MKDYKVPQLETERLILRAVSQDDIYDMYDYASLDKVAKYTMFKAHKSLEESKEVIQTVFLSRPDKGWPEAFALVLKSNGKMIGTCDFCPVYGDDCYEMGYVLNPDYWQKGLMSEAAKAVMKFAFEDYGVRRMEIRHLSENKASMMLIKKLKFKEEGIKRELLLQDGKYLDMYLYALLKEEYDEQRIGKKI